MKIFSKDAHERQLTAPCNYEIKMVHKKDLSTNVFTYYYITLIKETGPII